MHHENDTPRMLVGHKSCQNHQKSPKLTKTARKLLLLWKLWRNVVEVLGKTKILGPTFFCGNPQKKHMIQSTQIPPFIPSQPEVWSPQAKTAPSLRNAANARGADWICKISSFQKTVAILPRFPKAFLGGKENSQEHHENILIFVCCYVSSSNEDEEVQDANLMESTI